MLPRPGVVASAVLLVAVAAVAAPYDLATKDAPAAKDGSIGTAAPMGGFMSAYDGRWFVLCQARKDTDGNGKLETIPDIHYAHGDKLAPYLVLGSGAGMAIDYPVAHSAKGEWLVVLRDSKLELIEAATFHRWVLTDADLRNDHHWMEQKNGRQASVAANGKRLVYQRTANGKDTIVIRDLATQAERLVPVKDKLWRATVSANGRWARVTVMRKDTDKDGKIDWPGGDGGALQGCDADVIHAGMGMIEGDAATELWLDLDAGTFVEDKTIETSIGDALLRRRKDGALLLDKDVIVDAKCNAEIVSVLADPPRVAVTCGKKPTKDDDYKTVPVQIVGPGFKKLTTYEVPRRWATLERDRFAHAGTTITDLSTGEAITAPGSIEASHEHLFLVKTATGFAIFDALTRGSTPVAATGDVEPSYRDFLVKIGTQRFDLRFGGKALPAGEVVFVDPKGRALALPTFKGDGYGPGPLRWVP